MSGVNPMLLPRSSEFAICNSQAVRREFAIPEHDTSAHLLYGNLGGAGRMALFLQGFLWYFGHVMELMYFCSIKL